MKNQKYSKKKSGKGNDYGKRGKNAESRTRDERSKCKTDESGFYGGNDVSWYFRNAELTESSARIPFAYQPGRTIPMGDLCVPIGAFNESDTVAKDINYTYPGLMTLGFYPSVGYSDDIASPINIAARELYARVRSKYSGALEADAPDIMMYVLAIDSLYMYLEDMKRAYYLINSVTPANNMYPKLAIRALGWDYDDLFANRTRFYQTIVEYGSLLKKFMVPDNMDLFKRHQFMCANIYADAPTSKSQHYMFKLEGWYALRNTSSKTELAIATQNVQFRRLDDACIQFKTSLDSIMGWDTAYTITGYLERAYEGEQFLVPSPVIEDAVLVPVYNPEVLLQIHNASATRVEAASLNITQDVINGNKLVSTPCMYTFAEGSSATHFAGVHPALPSAPLVSIPESGTPAPSTIVIATRLTMVPTGPAPRAGDTDAAKRWSISCGTEVVVRIDYWIGMNQTPVSVPHWTSYVNIGDVDNPMPDWDYHTMHNLGYLSAFAHHPHMYLSRAQSNDGSHPEKIETDVFAEVDNVTSVDAEDIINMHRMCIYSEFNAFR